jgi:hypothetical protein
MNRESIVLLFLASAAFAQKEAPKFTVGFEDGTVVGFHTESTGANSLLSTSGSVEVAAGDEAYRFVLDQEDHVIFGYSIEAQKLGQGKFAVRIKPVDQEKVRLESKFLRQRSTGDIPTLASARDFPPLRTGDAVQVDILYNPGTARSYTTSSRLWASGRRRTKRRIVPQASCFRCGNFGSTSTARPYWTRQPVSG